MSLLELAVTELKALPESKLAEATRVIRGLRAADQAERLAALEQAGGSITPEDAAALEAALAKCRRVDFDE